MSVLKLKCQPRITFVSVRLPSANDLFFASIVSGEIGSFASPGQAATSIARRIALPNGMHFWCLGCQL